MPRRGVLRLACSETPDAPKFSNARWLIRDGRRDLPCMAPRSHPIPYISLGHGRRTERIRNRHVAFCRDSFSRSGSARIGFLSGPLLAPRAPIYVGADLIYTAPLFDPLHGWSGGSPGASHIVAIFRRARAANARPGQGLVVGLRDTVCFLRGRWTVWRTFWIECSRPDSRRGAYNTIRRTCSPHEKN